MRGPAIFLLSVAGAAILGVVLLRPALAERDRLRAELKALDGAGEPTPSGLARALERLSEEIGAGRGEPARARVREIAARYAAEPAPRDDAPEVTFTIGFDRLSALLSALEPAAGALDAVEATSVNRTDRCRVRLAFRAGGR